MRSQNFLLISATVTMLITWSAFQLGCSSSSSTTPSASNGTDSTSNASQAAMAETNSQSQATESSTTVGLIDDGLDSQATFHPLSSTCSFASKRGTCSGPSPYTDTITWGECTIDSGKASMTGGCELT